MLKELLKSKRYILLDGAMGTELQKRGLKAGEDPMLLNLTSPETVVAVHKSYVDSGSDIIYTNTFGANRFKLGDDKTVEAVVGAAIKNARAAAGDKALVALDIGPIGRLIEPAGDMSFEEAYGIFSAVVSCGGDADLVVLETFTELYELKAALLAVKDNCDLPVMCSMSFEKDGRTFTGNGIEQFTAVCDCLGADALGINCSLGPKELRPLAARLCACTALPVFLKPNAGLPDPATGKYTMLAEEFAKEVAKCYCGDNLIFGGCCGTAPDYIAALGSELEALRPLPAPKKELGCSFVCSSTKTVIIDGVCVIGERINPTGKKKMKEALLCGDMDYILMQAVEQSSAGAQILDVNVGLPGVNEREMMVKAVKAVQSVSDLPLQLDSSDPVALEAGLRVANGKVIVNSVNGKSESLDAILPLVKKYGASVVALTLDEGGIPAKAEGRFEIAKRIVEKCDAMGIKRADVFVDCLTLTVATDQENAMETLRALKMCKELLGVKTVLGVSNISFGLPAREKINQSFLTMAMHSGLDLPIMNPNNDAMMSAVRAFRVLTAQDINSREYLAAYGEAEEQKTAVLADLGLEACIRGGLRSQARIAAASLLESLAPMDIINNLIIPALDTVGEGFEKGSVFLPQLIQCAAAAQSAFEVIGERISKGERSGDKIILATVKNDIHDIGKNIVKTLLENYGFDVIDLGKDVAPQVILDRVREEDCRLLGLSALMTTTVESMRLTVELVKESCPQCRIMVGGAVLTEDYARSIGADFYAKDAKASCDYAKKIFGC